MNLKKMKAISIFIILSFLQFFLNAQTDFAPIGAKWHYTKPLINYPDFSYSVFTSIKDTIINNTDCRIIQRYCPMNINGNFEPNYTNYFFYTDSNKVYYAINDQFQILYDFNKNAGDYWIRDCSINKDTVFVDSVSSISIDGQILKVQYIRNNCNFEMFTGVVIEKIGWLGYLFPYFTDEAPPEGGALRCYQDDYIDYFLQIPCDTFSTIVNEFINETFHFRVYPNPIGDILNIRINSREVNNKDVLITLYNVLGYVINQEKMFNNDMQINTSLLNKGIYFLEIVIDKERKIIKLNKI